jgi:glycosyltransferase involved in cell wall biosynthesis
VSTGLLRRVERRGWKEYADVRRRLSRTGSARSAVQTFGAISRRDHIGWEAATASGHERYRAVHPVPPGSAAIVCVSQRPENLGLVAANVLAQVRPDLELVYVANTATFDGGAIEAALAPVERHLRRVTVLSRTPDVSLGACLNAGFARTDARFVAKFDDDDKYAPNYLADALRAHGYAGAGIVGKHTYYAHLEETDELVLRFPGHEFTYTSTLAGSTLVLDRDRIGSIAFPDVSIGEDRALIAACNRRGISTFSADRFNFVGGRSSANSWTVSREQFVSGARIVGRGWGGDEVDR